MNQNSKVLLPKKNNVMLKLARIFLPIIIYYLVNQVVAGIGFSLLQMIKGDVTGTQSFIDFQRENMIVVTLVQGMGMLVACLVLVKEFKEEVSIEHGIFQKVISLKQWISLLTLGISSALACNIIFALTGFTGNSVNYEETAQSQFSLPLWLGIILYGVIAPFAEEWIFRGIVYHRMKSYFGVTSAIISSAIVFGLFHGNAVQTIYGALLGMVLAWSYERYGSFLVPVVLHGVINVVVYTVSTIPQLNTAIFQMNTCIVVIMIAIGSLIFIIRDTKKGNI